jgi:hypothetical protein
MASLTGVSCITSARRRSRQHRSTSTRGPTPQSTPARVPRRATTLHHPARPQPHRIRVCELRHPRRAPARSPAPAKAASANPAPPAWLLPWLLARLERHLYAPSVCAPCSSSALPAALRSRPANPVPIFSHRAVVHAPAARHTARGQTCVRRGKRTMVRLKETHTTRGGVTPRSGGRRRRQSDDLLAHLLTTTHPHPPARKAGCCGSRCPRRSRLAARQTARSRRRADRHPPRAPSTLSMPSSRPPTPSCRRRSRWRLACVRAGAFLSPSLPLEQRSAWVWMRDNHRSNRPLSQPLYAAGEPHLIHRPSRGESTDIPTLAVGRGLHAYCSSDTAPAGSPHGRRCPSTEISLSRGEKDLSWCLLGKRQGCKRIMLIHHSPNPNPTLTSRLLQALCAFPAPQGLGSPRVVRTSAGWTQRGATVAPTTRH